MSKRAFALGPVMGCSSVFVVALCFDMQLHGSKTATGKPYLCNDPHLSLLAPSYWHAIHLQSTESGYNVIGNSLVGIPGVRVYAIHTLF